MDDPRHAVDPLPLPPDEPALMLADHTAFRVCIDCGKEHQEKTCPYCRRTFEKPETHLVGSGEP